MSGQDEKAVVAFLVQCDMGKENFLFESFVTH
jgi:hypothetical protein